jgi:hypothetical protein
MTCAPSLWLAHGSAGSILLERGIKDGARRTREHEVAFLNTASHHPASFSASAFDPQSGASVCTLSLSHSKTDRQGPVCTENDCVPIIPQSLKEFAGHATRPFCFATLDFSPASDVASVRPFFKTPPNFRGPGAQ